MGHTKASQLCTQFCAKMTTCVQAIEHLLKWVPGECDGARMTVCECCRPHDLILFATF